MVILQLKMKGGCNYEHEGGGGVCMRMHIYTLLKSWSLAPNPPDLRVARHIETRWLSQGQ